MVGIDPWYDGLAPYNKWAVTVFIMILIVMIDLIIMFAME